MAVLLYDGDCGFCRKWMARWNLVFRGQVTCLPYQQTVSRYPQISEAGCRAALQLIMPDGAVLSGAHAFFKALAVAGRGRGWLWFYEHITLFGRLADMSYRFIARHRC